MNYNLSTIVNMGLYGPLYIRWYIALVAIVLVVILLAVGYTLVKRAFRRFRPKPLQAIIHNTQLPGFDPVMERKKK